MYDGVKLLYLCAGILCSSLHGQNSMWTPEHQWWRAGFKIEEAQ